MKKIIPIPEAIKKDMQQIAQDRLYPEAMAIMARGRDDELVLESQQEAQIIVNIARVEMMLAALQYPFWDEDNALYQVSHELAFHDVQMGLFEKVIRYLGTEYQVITTV